MNGSPAQKAETAGRTDRLLTERQAAEMLAVSPTTLATWRSRRRYSLRWVQLGGGRCIRYRLSDCEAFIEAGLVQDEPEAAS